MLNVQKIYDLLKRSVDIPKVNKLFNVICSENVLMASIFILLRRFMLVRVRRISPFHIMHIKCKRKKSIYVKFHA